MSLRKQAEILGITPAYLSYMINGKRPWNPDLKDRYEQLANTLPKSVNKTSQTESGRGGGEMRHLGAKHSKKKMVSRVGFEPTTLGLKVRCSAN